MSSTLVFAPAPHKQPAQLKLVSAQPVRFDAAFIERRMREHHEWQDRLAAEAASEIITEVALGLQYVEEVRARRLS